MKEADDKGLISSDSTPGDAGTEVVFPDSVVALMETSSDGSVTNVSCERKQTRKVMYNGRYLKRQKIVLVG